MTAVVGGGRAASPIYVGRVGAFSALSGRCRPFKRHFSRGKGVCRVLTESSDDAPRVAPGFALLEPLTSKTVTLDECVGAEGVVVMFICNHCPFVVHLKQSLVDIATEYQPKGVNWVAICSNSVETHPADGPDKMAEEAKQLEYPFPYLYDETQDVAKAYKAACTPEFYVYDAKMQLHYHGQFDDSRPRNDKPITGRDLRNALDALIRGQPLEGQQAPSIGCNIKWTPGNEPSYFGVQGS